MSTGWRRAKPIGPKMALPAKTMLPKPAIPVPAILALRLSDVGLTAALQSKSQRVSTVAVRASMLHEGKRFKYLLYRMSLGTESFPSLVNYSASRYECPRLIEHHLSRQFFLIRFEHVCSKPCLL